MNASSSKAGSLVPMMGGGAFFGDTGAVSGSPPHPMPNAMIVDMTSTSAFFSMVFLAAGEMVLPIQIKNRILRKEFARIISGRKSPRLRAFTGAEAEIVYTGRGEGRTGI